MHTIIYIYIYINLILDQLSQASCSKRSVRSEPNFTGQNRCSQSCFETLPVNTIDPDLSNICLLLQHMSNKVVPGVIRCFLFYSIQVDMCAISIHKAQKLPSHKLIYSYHKSNIPWKISHYLSSCFIIFHHFPSCSIIFHHFPS